MNFLFRLFVSFFIASILYALVVDERPVPFPLVNGQANYRIGKLGNHYAVFYRDGAQTISVMIGSSKVDVEHYLGRRVHVRGEFRRHASNTQCILDRCHRMFSDPRQKAIVVDVDSVNGDE